MTEMYTDRFTKIYLALWGICVFAALTALILYKFGYRLTNRLEPVKVGSIALSSNQENFQIFLNNRERRPEQKSGYYTLPNITPGLHSVVVSKEGFWPWAKTVTVSGNTVRSLYAFMFPTLGIAVKTLPLNGPEYLSALKTFKFSALPELKHNYSPLLPDESLKTWLNSNAPSRKLSLDKTTALYVQDNVVYVAWISDSEAPPHYFCEDNPCKLKMPVVVSKDLLKSVDFYKGRRDVIIFSAGLAIYAIEVDREGTQNFQPIYKGVEPYFYETGSGVLYIKDGSSFLRADL